jgi:hypothetical protein
MQAHLIHGVVARRDRKRRAHRLYVSTDDFVRHLRSGVRYGSPAEILGDANAPARILTVDDSTRGGAEACLIARELGHEVMFFINPEPVVSGQPYFFSLFDTFVDARKVDLIEIEGGRRLRIDSPAAIRTWWCSVRASLMVLDAEASLATVQRIGLALGCADSALPDHLKPVSRAELIQLRDAGVRVENHGWTHLDLAGMTHASFCDHYCRAQQWLRKELGVASVWYASPFGRTEMPREWLTVLERPYFLADPQRPCGRFGMCGAINRHDITNII